MASSRAVRSQGGKLWKFPIMSTLPRAAQREHPAIWQSYRREERDREKWNSENSSFWFKKKILLDWMTKKFKRYYKKVSFEIFLAKLTRRLLLKELEEGRSFTQDVCCWLNCVLPDSSYRSIARNAQRNLESARERVKSSFSANKPPARYKRKKHTLEKPVSSKKLQRGLVKLQKAL